MKCTWLHRQRIHSPYSARNQGPKTCNIGALSHVIPLKVPQKKHPWFSGSKRRAQGAATWLRTGVFIQNMAHDM